MAGLIFFQLLGPDVQQKADALQCSPPPEKANSQDNASVSRLNRKAVPPAVFIKHHFTAETVDHFYSKDSLVSIAPVQPHAEASV